MKPGVLSLSYSFLKSPTRNPSMAYTYHAYGLERSYITSFQGAGEPHIGVNSPPYKLVQNIN